MSTHLRAIPGKKPTKRAPAITDKQIAAIEFPKIMRLARMPKADLEAKVRQLAQDVYKCAAIAAQIVRQDKPSLVLFGPALMQLAHAHDDAKVLKSIIGMAEIRLAIALAVVEGDQSDESDESDE